MMLSARVKGEPSSTPWWIIKPNLSFIQTVVDCAMSYAQLVPWFIHRFMNGKIPLFRSFLQPLREQKQKCLTQL